VREERSVVLFVCNSGCTATFYKFFLILAKQAVIMGLAWQSRLGTGFSLAEMIGTPVRKTAGRAGRIGL
jgi:hypothetical protein